MAYPVMRTVPTGAMVNRGLMWRGFQQALGGRAGTRCVKGWDKDQDGRTVVRRDRKGGCSKKAESVCEGEER